MSTLNVVIYIHIFTNIDLPSLWEHHFLKMPGLSGLFSRPLFDWFALIKNTIHCEHKGLPPSRFLHFQGLVGVIRSSKASSNPLFLFSLTCAKRQGQLGPLHASLSISTWTGRLQMAPTALTEASDTQDLQFKSFLGHFKETVPLFVMDYGRDQKTKKKKKKFPQSLLKIICHFHLVNPKHKV